MIGPAERLRALQARGVAGQTRAFEDTDALGALDAITEERPDVVLIELGFADTPRGAALIKRIKADPTLAVCDLRVVAHDGRDLGQAATSSPPAASLDQRGTRRAPRALMPDGIHVQIDGNAATLINLSLVGAQVLSPTSLRPNQRVRFTLPDQTQPTRCRAAVAWAAFEIPQGRALYRAGIEFVDADQALVARFIQANKDKK